MQLSSETAENLFCSRCHKILEEPIFVCSNKHFACEDCSKVSCKNCKNVFKKLTSGEATSAIISSKTQYFHPYEPNDGFVEFGKPFILLRRGLCCHNFKENEQNFKFKWIINPHEGIIQINLSPKEVCRENWFILEFAHPLDLNKKVKKEWILCDVLKINFSEVEDLYYDDTIVCTIFVLAIPIGNCVKTIEDVIRDGFCKIFNFDK